MKARLLVYIALLALGVVFVAAGTAEGGGKTSRELESRWRSQRLGLGSRLAATLMLNGGFPASWIKEAGGESPPSYLRWPMPGHRLGRGFGSNGGKHLAVDVTADIGTPVRAMASGMVGYADDGVRGYGKMVMIVHPGGWVTLYAHLDRYRVEPGRMVRRGEVIALSGNTGLSRGPHLHFALIVRGKPVDPMLYMRGAPGHQHRVSMLSGSPARNF
jgi:murein DD-endopeptidase MepM/ murein hydrolase activator NlpD